MSDPRERIAASGRPVGKGEPSVLVAGGEKAKGLASHLAERCGVVVVSDDEEVVRSAERDGLAARQVDLTSGTTLVSPAETVDAAVVAAERDRTSLLSAQLLRTVCGIEAVVVLLNDPGNREHFENVDVELLVDRTVGQEVERALFDEPA